MTLVRRALAEVCAVPMLLVLAVTNEKIVSKMTSITVWAPLWEVQYAFRCALKTGREGAELRLLATENAATDGEKVFTSFSLHLYLFADIVNCSDGW